jgi:hypothetical protein
MFCKRGGNRKAKRTPGGPIYYEFSTPEELRELILKIDELRELVRPRRVRIPFFRCGEIYRVTPVTEGAAAGLNCGNRVRGCPTCQRVRGGGIGKTALAAELGRLFEAQQFDFVLFLNASTPETLEAELASLCASDALNLPEQTAKKTGGSISRSSAVVRRR